MSKVHTWSDRQARTGFVLSLVLTTAIGTPTAWGADPLGEKELAAGRDPSFESVSSHFPPMKRPREAVGVKDGRDEFVVLPDAAVQFSNDPKIISGSQRENLGVAVFVVDSDRRPKGEPVRRRLVDGYLPIVITSWDQKGLWCEQTVLGWSESMQAETPLWAYMRLKLANRTDEPRAVKVDLQTECGKPPIIEVAKRWQFELKPGGEHGIHVKLPFDGTLPREGITTDSPEFKNKSNRFTKLPFLGGFQGVEEVTAAQYEKCFDEAAAAWRRILSRGMTIKVPEQRVNDAYRAWLAYTFLNVDKIGGRYEPHDGSGFYEAIFGIMAAKYCNALGVMGYPDEARTYLDSLQTLISPEGCFFVSFGFVDTGTLLWVMDQHHQLTGDKAWLREAAPNMIKMCDWIIRKRNQSKAEQAKDSVAYGLISSRVGVDNLGTYYSYVTATSLCVGMEAAVRSLRALGMTDEAARILKESEVYRQDIERSMRRSVTEHDGMRILPVMPDTHKYLKRAAYKTHVEAEPGKGYTGHGYYALFGSIVLETQFLPACDESFRLIPELMERRDGLAMGMCTFGGKSGIDHAFTYGYWMNCLERDEVERVLLGFYGTLAYGMSRGTWAGVECTNMISGANGYTLPHLRSGTQQLRLLRNMLVREDGDRLILAQAAPQHWLAEGKQVAVLDAPTHFGKVSYTIDSHSDQGRIAVKLDPPGRTPPEDIVLHLRHPERAKIKGVSVDGKPTDRFGDGTVILEGLDRPAKIEVRYR